MVGARENASLFRFRPHYIQIHLLLASSLLIFNTRFFLKCKCSTITQKQNGATSVSNSTRSLPNTEKLCYPKQRFDCIDDTPAISRCKRRLRVSSYGRSRALTTTTIKISCASRSLAEYCEVSRSEKRSYCFAHIDHHLLTCSRVPTPSKIVTLEKRCRQVWMWISPPRRRRKAMLSSTR